MAEPTAVAVAGGTASPAVRGGEDVNAQDASNTWISVELVIQCLEAGGGEGTKNDGSVRMPQATTARAETGSTAASSRKRYQLFRSVHRVPAGTTIRQLIEMAYSESQSQSQSQSQSNASASASACDGSVDAHDPADVGVRVDAGPSDREGHPSGVDEGRVQAGCLIADIDSKVRGLSRHGRRAWLDDLLADADRVEVMLPILADARKARFERVAKNRARKWRMSS